MGSLDCITGSMKSGKSSELLRRLSVESEIGYSVLYINSSKDTRCEENSFSTHSPLYSLKMETKSIVCISSLELKNINIDSYDVIGIDEAQFFNDLETVIEWVENLNKKVIVSGLTSTYERKKFGKLLDLEPYADTFIKINGFCEKCAPSKRVPAVFTHKIVKNGLIEDIGGKDKYMILCRKCYIELN